jgi:hypothetical protein
MNTSDIRAQPGSHHGSKLIFAAATILFLFTTTTRASIQEFTTIYPQSFLKYTTKVVGPALGGSKTSVPQYVGSDTTAFFGSMWVDIQDTTIHCCQALTSAPRSEFLAKAAFRDGTLRSIPSLTIRAPRIRVSTRTATTE